MSSSATTNNNLYYFQCAISLIGLCITGALLFTNAQNQNVYIPIFTSIIFAWVPSPLTHTTSATVSNYDLQKPNIEEDKLPEKKMLLTNFFNKISNIQEENINLQQKVDKLTSDLNTYNNKNLELDV
jgi:hypothetical protein